MALSQLSVVILLIGCSMVDKVYSITVGVDQFCDSTIKYREVLVEIFSTADGVYFNVPSKFSSYDTLKDALEAIDEEVGGENG